ncbi:MAG: Asp-tRNA(Asn)/Glu-tRNA(Gln) amidotransferase subunit GatB [Candidatus Woesebacteria bacterium]|jgi:aspartyl-tRNA(Asn)/glutamyl-tRNA(Gln) amidotransferase subunit B
MSVNKNIFNQYELTVGIECHVQLKTRTKLFSGADNDARDADPNTTVSPLCFGLPGTLPVLNREAVHLAVRAGIALNAEIAKTSSFDRKHYFYPDLPKGYQITQLERPTVGKGWVKVPFGEGDFTVRITRAHIEEDAGKLTHPDGADYSLVDLNRAGTPLIEIVSEPDIHSAAQAKAFAQELHLLMKYAGVTEGNLYYGNMRFDVNISVAKKGANKLGNRTEIKNLNSFRSVERSVEYEFERQVELLQKGEPVLQETRGWSDVKQRTFSQRSKENAHDYRYFPDADLPPVELTGEYIASIRDEVEPMLPATLRGKLEAAGIRHSVAEILLLADVSTDLGYVQTIIKVAEVYGNNQAVFASNFLVNRDIKERKEATNIDEPEGLPGEQQFADVYEMLKASELSSNNSDALLLELRKDPAANVRKVAEQKGLIQQNDLEFLHKVIDEVLSDPVCQKAVKDVRAGEQKAIGFLVGQVMKRSQGRANPGLVSKELNQRLS